MLFAPTNISPSTFGGLGNGTVDATQPLVVSWQVNGNSAMAAFSITIYKQDAASTQVYSTGKLTDGCPFYGTDYAGNVQFFSYTIAASALSDAGVVNGEAYKIIIQQWWGDTDEESVTQTSASAFITRAAPTLSINSFSNPLASRSATFTAAYSQAQGDALMWVRWQIAAADETDEPILDTQNIYGTAQLQVSYDGFFTGTEYAVRCMIETVNGVQADTGWQNFNVDYSAESIGGIVTAKRRCGTSGVLVAWPALMYIPGEADGDYTITDGKLTLPEGSSVTWDTVTGRPMSYAPPWTIIWQGNAGLTGNVLEIGSAGGPLAVSITATALSVTLGETQLYSQAISAVELDEWTVVIRPNGISVQQTRFLDGLFPSTTLYPGATLYPVPVGFREIFGVFSSALDLGDFTITSLKLVGIQTCNYLYVQDTAMTDDEVDAIMQQTGYTPTIDWQGGTIFGTDFSTGLGAGNINTLGSGIDGFAIYRRDGDASTLLHIADLPLTTLELIDYGVPSQTSVQYYMFALGTTTYATTPLISSPVKPVFWNWTLLECSEPTGSDPAYHVLAEYAFGLNLSSGTISNNNGPELHENFTPYPLIQPKTVNYHSGSLSSYIGRVERGEYSDTVELSNAIMALSASQNALFLKNRRGDFWRVAISAAITLTTLDNSAEQAQSVALPWAEVGSMEGGVSIISAPGDEFWTELQGGEDS